MISAILLAKNDGQRIEAAIKQVSWVDEVIVINNDSEDDTEQKAIHAGAIVETVSGKNFSLLRNRGAQKANGPWMLYVDIDEEITDSLKQEILEIVRTIPKKDDPQAYIIKRRNMYLGTPWPQEDGMIRLVYKPSLEEWFGELHETAKIKGRVSELKQRMIHHTHRSLEEMVAKTNQWSKIEAQLRLSAKHPPIVPWRLFRVMFTGFYNSYITQSGWKAGTVGLIESIYQGFSMFITYAKLWEMQQQKLK